jgi:hypothetical protein
MFTNKSQVAGIHRAIVSFSSAETGEIRVRIPAKFGPETVVNISMIGRKKVNGVWPVPQIGEMVVVTADGADFSNVFILNVNPSV